jgi:hypothetical protein
MPRFCSHPLLALLLVGVLLVTSAATGQVDDRARELLSGLQGGEHADIRTLDQTMVTTIYAGGIEQTVRTRTRIDYEGRRAAIDTELAPGMAVRVVIADGQARMLMGGASMPVPPDMGGTYDALFERGADLLGEGVSASYDGIQSYGDLLTGHQVTVRNAAGLPGVGAANEQRLVFDDGGRLVGFVAEVPDVGVMVGVFDTPHTGSPFVGSDATVYLLNADGTSERFMRMDFDDVRVNEPIEPDAFE